MNPKQRFLEQVLASGRRNGIVSAEDMLEHATPGLLAEHLPTDLRAALIGASLAATDMNPDMVVDTLGIAALAEHMPEHVLFACITKAAASDVTAGSGKTRAVTATIPAAVPDAIPAVAKPAAKTPKPAKSSSPKKPGKAATSAKSAATAAVEKTADKSPSKPVTKASAGKTAAPTKASPTSPKPSTAASRAVTVKPEPLQTGDHTATKLTAAAPPEEPEKLPAPPAPPSAGSKSKSKSKPKSKPNVRAKAKPAVPSKRSTLPTRSEFDVDTDVGEDWDADVVVEEFEFVDEADVLGAGPLDAGDWQADEETKAGPSTADRKR